MIRRRKKTVDRIVDRIWFGVVALGVIITILITLPILIPLYLIGWSAEVVVHYFGGQTPWE
jgi:hypothetical protein